MKKLKFIKSKDFKPPTSTWQHKFRKYTKFKTRTGKCIYTVEYISSGRYMRPFVKLVTYRVTSWGSRCYYVYEHNSQKYIPIT